MLNVKCSMLNAQCSMLNVIVITYIPSPYQVEFFNAIALSGKFKLQVAYLKTGCNAPIAQQWQQPEINHDHLILDVSSENYQQLEQQLDTSDLVIFNYYRHPLVEKLIDRCLELNKSWCFWGERPGFKHAGVVGWLYRRWKLASLHESSAPIWGVGIWGLDQYRREFGNDRTYFDLPYFSNLSRFKASSRNPEQESRVFLYSGALIKRKGVDLLAAAFCRLAEEFKHIELHIVGDGELRPKLERKLTKYQQRVKFFGFQPWEKLPHYYQQADILCIPSRYDGWGLVIPEGLAAGLPVISTDTTGAAIELIRDGCNGWLIDADSEDELYKTMYQAAILSPQQLADYSQAASDRASRHTLAHGVQRFEDIATETIKQFSTNLEQKTNLKKTSVWVKTIN